MARRVGTLLLGVAFVALTRSKSGERWLRFTSPEAPLTPTAPHFNANGGSSACRWEEDVVGPLAKAGRCRKRSLRKEGLKFVGMQ